MSGEDWIERNKQGLCAECGTKLEGQTYLHPRTYTEPPIMICSGCMIQFLDQRISRQNVVFKIVQTELSDLHFRKEKVLKGEQV